MSGTDMVMLKAIIRPDKLDPVRKGLEAAGVTGLTVTEVRGHGAQKGHTTIYRGKEYDVTLLPKTAVEVVIPRTLVDGAVAAIISGARTGEIGDGRIFMMPVEKSWRIRTGEADGV